MLNQDKRRAARERAGNRCERCGANPPPPPGCYTGLEVHHRLGHGVPNADAPENLEVLCIACHRTGEGWRSHRRSPRVSRFQGTVGIRLREVDFERLRLLSEKLDLDQSRVVRYAVERLAEEEQVAA